MNLSQYMLRNVILIKSECTYISCNSFKQFCILHKPTLLLVEMQISLLMKNWPNFFPGTSNILLGKKICDEKIEKFKEWFFPVVCWNFAE